MIDVIDFEDGAEMKSGIKKSRYQVIPAQRLARFERPRPALPWERSKMKNPVYYRLMKDGSFAGFKRVVTEFLSPGSTRWQLDSIPHDDEATQKLSKPAMGIATLGREKIVTTKQRRVTNPQSKDQSGSDAWDRGRFLKKLNEKSTE